MSLTDLNRINISSLKNLSYSTSSYQVAMKRLSSGLKINAAQDDSANLSLSKTLDSRASGTELGTANIQQASAKLNTFGGYIQGIVDSLQKIRQIAVQSANGTYGASERASLNSVTQQASMDVSTASVQANSEMTNSRSSLLKPVKTLSDAEATAQGFTVIKTAADFKALISTNTAGKYILGGDLDMSSLGTLTKSVIQNNFTGTLDGNGYTMRNLTINSGANAAGVFAFANGATIKNLTLDQIKVTSNAAYAGSLAAVSNYGTVDNCVAQNISISNASAGGSTGGLVGETTTTITSSYTTGTVNGVDKVGGLAGRTVFGGFSGCFSSVNVSGRNNVGGLVGNTDSSTINSSYATGTVSGKDYVGGLAGYTYDGEVSDSFASGSVAASGNFAGGLLGYTEWDGGMQIRDCYALGSVKGVNNVGGFVGRVYASQVVNCYSKGDVSGIDMVGGFAGESSAVGTATKCRSEGAVSGKTKVGGFLGDGTDFDNTNFWNKDTSGQVTSAGGAVGYTNATMPDLSTTTSAWNTSTWDLTGDKPELKKFNAADFGVQSGATIISRYTVQNLGLRYTGCSSLDVSTVENARQTIKNVDNMLSYYTSVSAKTGAALNSLASQVNSNMSRSEGFMAGSSTIKDTDMAKESAQLSKYKMLQNFSATVLQQSSKLTKDFVLGVYSSL